MNKFFKIFLLALSLMVFILGAGFAYFLNSPNLQTDLANKNLEKYGIRLKYLHANFTCAKAEKIDISLSDGATLKIESADVKISILDLIFNDINIDSLNIKNAIYTLPISKLPREFSEQSNNKTQDRSIAKSINVTDNSKLKDISESQAQKNDILETLKNFNWNINLKDVNADLKIISIQNNSSITLKLEANDIKINEGMNPENANFKILGNIKTPQFSKNFKLNTTVIQKFISGSTISELQSIIDFENIRILELKADFSKYFENASFEMSLNTDSNQVASFVLNSSLLPKFKSDFYLKGGYEKYGKSANLTVATKNTASKFESFSPQLKSLKEVALDAELEAKYSNNTLYISKLGLFLLHNNENILNAKSTKEFEFSTLNASKLPSGELLEVNINAVSAELVNGFLNGIKLDFDDLFTSFKISRNEDNSIELKFIKPLVVNNFSYSNNLEKVVENLNFAITADSLLKPNGNLNSTLKLYTSDTPNFSITANLEKIETNIGLNISASGAIKPILNKINSVSSNNIPDISLNAKLNSQLKNDIFKLEKLEAKLFSKDSDLLSLKSSKFQYNTKTNEINFDTQKLLIFEAIDVPFAILKPFIKGADAQNFSLKGDINEIKKGEYIANISCSLDKLSYKKDSTILLRDLNFGLDSKIIYTDKKIEVNVSKLNGYNEITEFLLANISAKIQVLPMQLESLKLKSTIGIPQILNQPVLEKFNNLSRGSADITLDFSPKVAKLNLRATNLNLRSTGASIGSLNADIVSQNPLDFEAPNADIKLNINGIYGESIANLKLEVTDKITAILNGKSIVLEDFISIASAFSNPTYDNTSTASLKDGKIKHIKRPPEAKKYSKEVSTKDNLKLLERSDTIAKKDTKAIWDLGKNILATVKIDELLKDGRVLFSNVNSKLESTSEKLVLNDFSMNFYDAPLTASAHLFFDKNSTVPYTLSKTNISMQNFEISKIFANQDNPAMTGVFSATATLSGNGNNIEHLAQYIVGSGKFTANKGTLHILDKNSVVSKGSEIAGGAIKLASKLLNNKVKELAGIGEIISILHKVEYDSAQINISRSTKDYNIVISDSLINTPNMIFVLENGVIYFDANTKFTDYKMYMPVQMYLNSSLQKTFHTSAEDSKYKGYYKGPLFQITGTVSSPSNNLLDVITEQGKSATNAIMKTFKLFD